MGNKIEEEDKGYAATGKPLCHPGQSSVNRYPPTQYNQNPTKMLETIVTAFVIALATQYAAFHFQKKRLREELAEMYAAERIAKSLLEHEDWGKRTFEQIKKRIGGFDDDELRRILLRAGAVRFKQAGTGKEMWGLLSRNESDV